MMYTTIRKYKVVRGQPADVTREVTNTFVPQIKQIPGFVSYSLLESPDQVTTISVFETREGAQEAIQRAREFVRQRIPDRLSEPEITEGQVRVHETGRHGADVFVHHRVKDFTAWKQVFDEFEPRRRAAGEQEYRIAREPGEPNDLYLSFDWDNAANARRFMSSSELSDAMQRAGVLDKPEIHVTEEVARGTL
jgi:quinol monooxygenase YgiN